MFRTYKIKVEVEDKAGNIASKEREYKHTNILEIDYVSRDGFGVHFYTDEPNITTVQCPTWTDYNGQDDIAWYDDMSKSNYSYTGSDGILREGYSYYKDITSEWHKGESGVYKVDIYITSNGSRHFASGTRIWVPDNEFINIKEVSSGGFKIIYYPKVTNISKVEFAVWTDKNGQDDLVWHQTTKGTNGKYYYARVNVSSHKNESGLYIIHGYRTVNGSRKCFITTSITLP